MVGWTVTSVLALLVTAGIFWLWTPDRARADLEARYLAAPGDMVSVGDLRLHLRVSGRSDAPALILLHGFGSSLHTWEAWAQALSADYRVIRFDLPGAGLSPRDPKGNYTPARDTEVLAAVMDALGLGRASLVGNSLGGRIAWGFAARYPERVEKLVLISPDGFASPGIQYGQQPKVPAAVKLMRYVLPKPLLRMNLAPAYGDPANLTEAILSRYHDLMLAPGVRGAMIARMEQAVLPDPVPLLKRISAPTLLLWGERDAMIPIENAGDYLGALSDSTLVPLAGLGHVPHEESPAVSLEPVRAFLRR